MTNNIDKNQEEITRKDAIKKIGNYSKYAALTALGTYLSIKSTKSTSCFSRNSWN